MFTRLRENAIKFLGGAAVPEQQMYRVDGSVRGMPGQDLEKFHFMYARGPNAVDYLVQYALDAWVYTAVATLSTEFAKAALEVWWRSKPQKAEEHGLLRLLGPAGHPNEDQDRFEFFEAHCSDFLLTGMSYWYWWSAGGGAPEQVFRLPPEAMFVVPGASDVVGEYVLRWQGRDLHLPKEAVTQFKRYNPFSRYYGLSALEALRIEVESDRSMAEWNRQFFGRDSFAPAGILVVDDSVSDQEVKRLEADLEGKHGPRRRTAVVRGKPGSTVWVDAGLKHHELDFKEGRLLSRQAVFEALGLPLGLMSESSTEAHARVAERLMLRNINSLHARTATKLDHDALGFWPREASYTCRFEDVRQVDWQLESMRLKSVAPFMTKNEVREQILHLPGMAGEDELPQPVAPFGGGGFGQNGGGQDDEKPAPEIPG